MFDRRMDTGRRMGRGDRMKLHLSFIAASPAMADSGFWQTRAVASIQKELSIMVPQVFVEALEEIMRHLDLQSLVAVAGTCRDMRARAQTWASSDHVGMTGRLSLWRLWNHAPRFFTGVVRRSGSGRTLFALAPFQSSVRRRDRVEREAGT